MYKKLSFSNLSRLILIIFLLAFSQLTVGHTKNSRPSYTFGVVPQFGARHSYEIWRPILDRLEQLTQARFTLVGSTGIPHFEQQLMAGIFDFAYMNPMQLLLAHKKQGYQPLVRDVGRQLYGVIVVRKDSHIRHVNELQNKVIAFPSANAFGASLLSRAALSRDFKISFKPIYVKSHSSVYLNVLLGRASAGAGVQTTLNQQPAEVRDKLRVLYETQRVAPHPIAVHQRVPIAICNQVRNALLTLGNKAKDRALLSKIPIKTIGTADFNDYLPLKNMNLFAFWVGDLNR